MLVRALTPADEPAYSAFRRELWPSHPGSGHWEALASKYFVNPHRRLCPGSGLYGCFQGDRILGSMGAYPMPVTLRGALYPGHMLVDWAVLPKFRYGPIAGMLWNALIGLPGRKYASQGSRFSQGPLAKRGAQIPATEVTGLLRPLSGIAAKFLHLNRYSYPAPFHLDGLETTPGVSLLEGSQVRAAGPSRRDEVAWVDRDGEYWAAYCSARICHGAFPLRVASGAGEADLVIRIMETGPLRFGTLLAAHLEPYTTACAAATGKLLGKFLQRIKACVLWATAADAELQALVSAASFHVRRSPAHWWSIPAPADTFRHGQVSWWLTSADRDSHYGGLQPHTEI